MEVMIGVDPHPASHTTTGSTRPRGAGPGDGACRVAEQVPRCSRGPSLRRAHVGGRGRPRARLSALPAARRGRRTVVDVPATLASRVRVLGRASRPRPTPSTPGGSRSPPCPTVVWPGGAHRWASHGVPLVGEAPHRPGPVAQQAVLPAARPGRRAGAGRDQQRSRRLPGAITP